MALKTSLLLVLWCLLSALTPGDAAKFTRRKAYDKGGSKGAVFAMTNRVSFVGNSIVMYERAEDGTLTRIGLFDTGGFGGVALDKEGNDDNPDTIIDALQAQGSLILSENNMCLLAVNAGSNSFTVFRVEDLCLKRVGIFDSGGDFPVSIAQHKQLVYVLNAGGVGIISGFRFHENNCEVKPIDGSSVTLGNSLAPVPIGQVSPAQIGFHPTGKYLVAVNKGPNEIITYAVSKGGKLSLRSTTTSNGNLPFGFDFVDDDGTLLVSEGFGNVAVDVSNSFEFGAASSYRLTEDGDLLEVISGTVENGEGATCWLKYFGGYAFVSNTGSGTVSVYKVNSAGELMAVENSAVKTDPTSEFPEFTFPTDFALTGDGTFVYVLNTFKRSVSVLENVNGELSFLGVYNDVAEDTTSVGIIEGVAGIAVF